MSPPAMRNPALLPGLLLGLLIAAAPAGAGVVVQGSHYTVTYTGIVTAIEYFTAEPVPAGLFSPVQGSFAFDTLDAGQPSYVVTSPTATTASYRFLAGLTQVVYIAAGEWHGEAGRVRLIEPENPGGDTAIGVETPRGNGTPPLLSLLLDGGGFQDISVFEGLDFVGKTGTGIIETPDYRITFSVDTADPAPPPSAEVPAPAGLAVFAAALAGLALNGLILAGRRRRLA